MRLHVPSVVMATSIFLLTGPAAADQERFSGRVVAVTDGDTIKVLREGKEVKVRLSGVDCPEKAQAFGKRAKRFVIDLVAQKVVTVIVEDTDRYKRLVGRVELSDGRCLNNELVRQGLAWWYERYDPDNRVLQRLQMIARSNQRGLWADPNPVPPWEFRKQRRKKR